MIAGIPPIDCLSCFGRCKKERQRTSTTISFWVAPNCHPNTPNAIWGGGWGCSLGIHELPGSSHWLKRFVFCWPGTSRRVLKRMAKPLASKRPFGFFSMTKWVSQQGGLPVVGVYIPMKQGFPSKGGIIPICAFCMISWWFLKYFLFLPLLGEMI